MTAVNGRRAEKIGSTVRPPLRQVLFTAQTDSDVAARRLGPSFPAVTLLLRVLCGTPQNVKADSDGRKIKRVEQHHAVRPEFLE